MASNADFIARQCREDVAHIARLETANAMAADAVLLAYLAGFLAGGGVPACTN